MLINYILHESQYSNGFGLDHVQMFIEDMKKACIDHDPKKVKIKCIDHHGVDILVIYTDKFDKKELHARLAEDGYGDED